MADFISVDIDPSSGALQATWANDANQLATLPTTPHPRAARHRDGPRRPAAPVSSGTGKVKDTRFATTVAAETSQMRPVTRGFPVRSGGERFPVSTSRTRRCTGPAPTFKCNSTSRRRPAASSGHHESDDVVPDGSGSFDPQAVLRQGCDRRCRETSRTPPGSPKSFDRLGLQWPDPWQHWWTTAGGTVVRGARTANGFTLTIPSTVVGNPVNGELLEAVTAYSVLDNGLPTSRSAPVPANVPTLVDATPSARRAVVGCDAHRRDAAARASERSRHRLRKLQPRRPDRHERERANVTPHGVVLEAREPSVGRPSARSELLAQSNQYQFHGLAGWVLVGAGAGGWSGSAGGVGVFGLIFRGPIGRRSAVRRWCWGSPRGSRGGRRGAVGGGGGRGAHRLQDEVGARRLPSARCGGCAATASVGSRGRGSRRPRCSMKVRILSSAVRNRCDMA